MNEKLSLLTELIKMAKSDNDFRDEEFNFLYAIAQQLGVSDDAFKSLFDEHIAFTPPKNELDRIVQFQRLVLMMHVDQEISESELHNAKEMGIHLGLSPTAIATVLEEMHLHENGVIPPDRLIAIFKTQHN